MNRESIVGTVLMAVGFLVIMPIGFCFPDKTSIMMLGVNSFIAGAVLLFDSNNKIHKKQTGDLVKKEITAKNKEIFYSRMKPFFDEGLMYEIHSSDKISVCNLANEDYCVFNYDDVTMSPTVVGVSFNKDVISDIINHNNKIFVYIKEGGIEYVNENLIYFTPQMKDIMREVKTKNDIKGPSEKIDFEWEEHIRNRMRT